MTPATVLAILVATGEANLPATTSMAAAAAEVVGEPHSVEVVEVGRLSDAEALRVERELGTLAVATLTWPDSDRRRARLRLYAVRANRWIDRELEFVAADTLPERGRTLGFATASMLPEGDPTIALAGADAAPMQPPRPLGANAVEASFLAAAGLDGPAGGIGGRLAFERFVRAGASMSLSLAGRGTPLDLLASTEITASVGLGAALWPMVPAAGRRLALAIRGEALLLYEAVEHTDAGGATTQKGHAMPGGAVDVAAVWRVAGPLELVVSAGTELAAGTVDVTVVAASPTGGSARIPAVRARTAAGVRFRF
jgi:hypothetical protein